MKKFPPLADEVEKVEKLVSSGSKNKPFETAIADAFQKAGKEAAVKEATGKTSSQIISRAIEQGKKVLKKERIEANRNLHQSFQTVMSAAAEPAKKEVAKATFKQAAKASQKLASAKGAQEVIQETAIATFKQVGKNSVKSSNFLNVAWNAIKRNKALSVIGFAIVTIGLLSGKSNTNQPTEYKLVA